MEATLMQWEDGQKRLAGHERLTQRAFERIVKQVAEELRRRLGGSFSINELIDLYDAGTDWCLELAMSLEPERPELWDSRIVTDASFAQYAREATDYRLLHLI